MKNTIQKVMLSTALAASLGAVAVVAPIGGNHAFAASDNQSSHEKNKKRAEDRANNAAFLAAQAEQFNALFGTPEEVTANQPENNAVPSTDTAAKQDILVVVPQGASLTEIAAQYGVTVDELVAANNLLPAGYQLTVPQK
ncbi:LysM peptidoglycan-binding domain-containing protein [Paenibacillus wulumuqiensis]|uniref:LysM peptidoglycan-binding domain-containing protein n=1 Tax=Paenibacillus wulumuqiensis TaxID=1567107 RepID=UPI00061A0349|nr:LysM peptidoglycan-binding domain-containing protein [Paenibacillus wulumuqiensis]